jgi:hypothetical protein
MKRAMLAMLFSLAVVSAAGADTVTVLGPAEFLKTGDSAATYEVSFPAIKGPCLIRIQNGDSAQSRSSAAEVWLNGKRIVKASSLNPKISALEISTARLEAANAMRLWVDSRPGCFLRITVTQQAEGAAAGDLVVKVFSNNLRLQDQSALLAVVEPQSAARIQSRLENLTPEGLSLLASSIAAASPVTATEAYMEYASTISFPNGKKYVGKLILIKTESGWKFTEL